MDDDKVEDFIRYTNAHHIQVVWTLYMTSRTLDRELAYVQQLMKRGMNITAFEYGGEFYLPKYARADTSKKGVVEKVTPAIYDRMLKQWLPAFVKLLPFSKGDHIIVGASHGSTDSAADKHRQNWNLAVIMPIEQRYPDDIGKLSWSFHLYMGNKSRRSPTGEERVVAKPDFAFMHDFPAQMTIFVTESGYYVRNFSAGELQRAGAFWTSLYRALRPGDVFGIHTLINKGNKPNPLALINRDGRLSPVGQAFQGWLKTLDAKPGKHAWSGNTPVAGRAMPAPRPAGFRLAIGY